MTSLSWVLLGLALPFAVANWWSRWRPHQVVEWITKPTVTTLVLLAAVALEPADGAMRVWFVAAFALCLVGDVALMLPVDAFVVGLGAFLLGHLAFVAGFVAGGLDDAVAAAVAVAALVLVLGTAGRRILVGARRQDRALTAPVAAYLAVIGTMAVVAAAHGNAWGIAGAGAFVVSDSLLGWDRFVAGFRAAPVAVMVTYHAALVGLLLALP